MGVQLSELQVGDEIEVLHRGTVKYVGTDGWGIDYHLGGGETRSLFKRDLGDSAVTVTVTKPAPKPFVVGEPLTPEMGEPPLESVIRTSTGAIFHRRAEGWVGVSAWDTRRVYTYDWPAFIAPSGRISATLLHLGGAA